MFSGLIRFIRPSGTLNRTAAQPVERLGSATDGHKFELDPRDDDQKASADKDKGRKGEAFNNRSDTLSLSLDGLEKAIETMDVPQIKQKELREIFARLRQKGIKTLPFDSASSLIEQVEQFDRTHQKDR